MASLYIYSLYIASIGYMASIALYFSLQRELQGLHLDIANIPWDHKSHSACQVFAIWGPNSNEFCLRCFLNWNSQKERYCKMYGKKETDTS